MTIHIEYHETAGQAIATLSTDQGEGTISGETCYVTRQVAMQVRAWLLSPNPTTWEEVE